jgi:hypothetical protein
MCIQSRPALGPTQWGSGVLSQRVKQPKRAVDHTPSSSGEVKTEWSNTSASPLYLHTMYGTTLRFLHFLKRRADALNFGTWPACHGSLRPELNAWVGTRCCNVECPCLVMYLSSQTNTCLDRREIFAATAKPSLRILSWTGTYGDKWQSPHWRETIGWTSSPPEYI